MSKKINSNENFNCRICHSKNIKKFRLNNLIFSSKNNDWKSFYCFTCGGVSDYQIQGKEVNYSDGSYRSKKKTYNLTNSKKNDDTSLKVDENDTDIVKQIKELLDTRVRPAVAMDGGDIVYDSFKDGVVYLHMQGACSGCPSSTATLKMGIENMLKHYVPEVQEVRPIDA